MTKVAARSLHAQAELPDQRRPLRLLAVDVGGVVLRGRRQRVAAVGGDTLGDVGRPDEPTSSRG